MTQPIEDYALVGDCRTAALVGKDGSIDWLCLPRFDAPACFAALLGTSEHGRWRIAPVDADVRTTRRYRGDTMILETEFETASGAVLVIDCMPLEENRWDFVRIVAGLRGRVAMRMELVIRFDYGSIVPWVRRTDGSIFAIAGPDTLELRTPVDAHGEGEKTLADFEVGAGRPRSLRHQLSPVARGGAASHRRRGGAAHDREALARLVVALHRAAALAARRRALAADAQVAHLQRHRRHRRRADDLAARAAGRRAQLGLPLLLAPRCHLHAERAAPRPATPRRRSPGASGCCAPSPAAPPTCRSSTA